MLVSTTLTPCGLFTSDGYGYISDCIFSERGLRQVVKEYLAVGRLDQDAIALGDRVGERDISDTERREIDRSAALDDIELDLARQPLLARF